ncbi:MAG: tripartite tricarboxylate transporter TctB family protein [Pseudomonadota bacterium]
MKLSRDGWGGLAVLAASLLLFWLTLGLKDSPLVPIGPGFYPRIVLGLTGLLSLFLVVRDLLSKKAPETKARANYGAVVLHFAVFGLYVAALPGLGFRIATFAYVAAANALMDAPRGAKGWARVALIAFVTALATWFVFERELLVLLPRGRWTDF